MEEEKRRAVAFLGPEGSYTHQAALDAFPPSTTQTTLYPEITIEDVFSTVQSGTAYRGVVPFENSSNGSVVFTLDLFADLNNKYPDILVCGEAYVDVKHCLLGYSSNPAATHNGKASDMSRVKKLYSHPQAWGQCKDFLARHLKTAERHDVSSTSKAAEIASRDASGESAALSSEIAAELFGLHVLAREINDKKGNSTRFFVIRRKRKDDDDDSSSRSSSSSSRSKTQALGHVTEGRAAGGKEDKAGNWKSLVTFTVEHSNPGALANCLTVFSSHGINLTSINTRPSGVRNWHYVFFVEFKGRKTVRGDGDVNQALKELDKVCRGWRWLGSWENRLVEEEEEEEEEEGE